MAAPILKKQARTDETATRGHTLFSLPAAEEEGEIAVRAKEEALVMATAGCSQQSAHRLATSADWVSWKVKQTFQGLGLEGRERAAAQGARAQETSLQAATAGTSVVIRAGERV